jgi:lysophospholipase L1-like esterase
VTCNQEFSMKNILIFGDSNSWGYDSARYDTAADAFKRMTETERWPAIVRTLLGSGYNVTEDALNGRTCVWDDPYMPHRNGLPALQAALDANAPLDLVVIQLGCNELKDYFNLNSGMIARGMDRLVRECAVSYYGYPAPKVLLIAPAPTHPDIAKIRPNASFGPGAYRKSLELGPLYRAIAEKRGCGFIDCGELGFEINTVDGLHYSYADHAKLAPLVAAKIREMLGDS